MEFDNNNISEPLEPTQPSAQGIPAVVKTPRKRSGWRVFWGIVMALSVMANIILFLMVVGLAVVFAAGQSGIFTEEVIQEGPRTAKIAVITVDGVIDDRQAENLGSQMKQVQKDQAVKAVIVQINSPGGTVSASDRIHNQIKKWRQETNKPTVAFMQGLATSGGYYGAVACERIVAEPTAITGSIGVIMGHFVVEQLLEDKLGIQPVIVKSGRKKDWPSLFQMPTEEQQQYLQDRLITPAYERFVEVVDEGREPLTLADVRRLADGGIYSAGRALDEKLIDEIGYLDDAINLTLALAGIEEAQVVEYRRPFSLAGFLGHRSGGILKIDKATLYELSMPQVLYLWSIY